MGTNLNFKSYGNEPPGDGGGGRLPGNVPLARQTSIYSLTFDELQSTMGGVGKDFGSMNMDELLKNIWSAEEIQSMASSSGAQDGAGGAGPGGYLQRQGSLTLPRTLSTKTVDEVWKNISKEYVVGKDGGGGGGGGSNQPQRQQTLGEMTLEEFLVRAGVVREDIQLGGANNGGFFGELSRSGNTNGLGIGFQQTGRNTGFMGNNRISDTSNQVSLQSPNLPLNVNGVRSNQQQLQQSQQQGQAQLQAQAQAQAQAHIQQHQQQHFPKQPTVAYASQMPLSSGGAHLGSPGMRGGGPLLGSPGMRGGIVGMSSPGMNGGLIHNAALQGGGLGIVGLGAGAVTVATNSPANQLSSDGMGKSNGDTSSVSPVPYVFNGGLRGRRCNGTVEKVVERRQRRMIKNRESAARSRARKQAYTMELEAEVAKLKEENEGLRKKQEEIMEMQKNQVVEMMNIQRGGKKQCLRRTQTGPW